jgi:hypothetical protein
LPFPALTFMAGPVDAGTPSSRNNTYVTDNVSAINRACSV